MTRRTLVLALVLVAAGAVTATAQDGGNVLYSHIDLPAKDQIVDRQSFVLHGWAFNCSRGGQQPYTVRVRLFTASGPTDVAVTRKTALYRPDVKAAFAGTCPEMSSFTGYALAPADWTALPVGTFTVTVEWADSNGAVYSQQRVTLQ